jgi:hypothetical protein
MVAARARGKRGTVSTLANVTPALLYATAIACGPASGNLAGSPTDGGDASTSDVATSSDVSADAVPDASTAEAAALGDAQSGDGSSSDSDAQPYLGSMQAAPTMALLRLANWSPDSPPVDICIAPHGTTAFQGPLVAALAVGVGCDGGAAGLPFPFASAYTPVPPGRYDARVVVAGATSCSVGILPDATSLPTLAVSSAETVALVGAVAPSGADYGLALTGFLDDLTAPAGSSAIRAINAAPAMSQVDVGTGALFASSFLAIFRGVPFDHASAPNEAWIPYLVDANGYNSNKPISNSVLSAHASSSMVDAVSASGFSAPSGSVITIVVAGGTSSTSPALVVCADNAGTVCALSDCNVLSPAGM